MTDVRTSEVSDPASASLISGRSKSRSSEELSLSASSPRSQSTTTTRAPVRAAVASAVSCQSTSGWPDIVAAVVSVSTSRLETKAARWSFATTIAKRDGQGGGHDGHEHRHGDDEASGHALSTARR